MKNILFRGNRRPIPTSQHETVMTVTPEDVQFCAHCGAVGARNRIIPGYWYLGGLPFVRICDECNAKAIQAKREQLLRHMRTETRLKAIRLVSAQEA